MNCLILFLTLIFPEGPTRRPQKEDESVPSQSSDPDTFGTMSIGPVPIKDYVGSALKKELMRDEVELGLSGMDDFEEDDVKFLPAHEDKWTMNKLSKKVKELVGEMKVWNGILFIELK